MKRKNILHVLCVKKFLDQKEVSPSILDLCSKNLTFPEAECEQRCPSLFVVIFCLFFESANQIYHLLA